MEINFRHEINGQKVITAVAQDADTNQILMLANMNKEALQKNLYNEDRFNRYSIDEKSKLKLKPVKTDNDHEEHDIKGLHGQNAGRD